MKQALTIILLSVAISGSAFAAPPSTATNTVDLTAMMTAAEVDYYKKSFSYAMDAMKNNQVYDWRTETSEGQVRPGKHFKSKSGVKCRTFAEAYTIHKQKGQKTGYGCKREGDYNGWCKLKKGDMLNCSFEPADGIFETIVDGANGATGKASGYKKRVESSFWDWLPF